MSTGEREIGMKELTELPGTQQVLYEEEEDHEERVPLSQYLWILRRYRWRILGFVFASVIATWVVSSRLRPVYESVATVDVDRQTPAGVVGQEALRTSLNDADQYLATQIKMVPSDSVLRPADRKLHLVAREIHPDEPGAPSDDSEPVVLRQLKVTRPPNTYLIQISYRSPDPQLAADAANAIAQSYLEHNYEIRMSSSARLSSFMEHQMEELKAKMERSNQALVAAERDLNVVNPEDKVNILASRLLQLNTDYSSAQADRLRKQAAWEAVRGGSVDAAFASAQAEPLRKQSERWKDAKAHFAEVQSFFGPGHPEYQRAEARLAEAKASLDWELDALIRRAESEFNETANRENLARAAVREAKTEFDRTNARSFQYISLKREADADKSLYDELIRKIKEAGINTGFQNSEVRIADPARPSRYPVSPNIPLNVMLALLFSSLVAVGGAVAADLLDKTIRDPDQVSRTLRTEVIGSLPLMKNRPVAGYLASSTADSGQEGELSGFHESIRTLRNSILLASFDHRYRSLLVTSASPGEGKTTTAVNLAATHAEQGKRTLLIDGDLRRPSVHLNFNLPSVAGLSNALRGEVPWREVVMRVEGLEQLDILPAGPPSRRAPDLVGRGLAELIDEASAEYDLVVLDAPPLLGFAEPLEMATATDGVLVVTRAGQTTRKAVASVLSALSRVRAKVVGVVLNEVHQELSDSYYYYGYYRSYYRARDTAGESAPPQRMKQGAGV